MNQIVEIKGFSCSNDNGQTWFYFEWSNYWGGWVVNEPESLCFSTEDLLVNKPNYTKCFPIFDLINKPSETTNGQLILDKEEMNELIKLLDNLLTENVLDCRIYKDKPLTNVYNKLHSLRKLVV